MNHVFLAQLAQPLNWFSLLIAGAILLFAVLLLLEATGLPSLFRRKTTARGSRVSRMSFALMLGTLGWFFIAKELGLPFAGPGPLLVRDFIAQVALFGLAMLGWTGITLAIQRWRSKDDVIPIDNIDNRLEVGEMVLWRGRPDYRLFRNETWAAFIFGCILLLPGSAGVGLTVFGIWEEGPKLAFSIPLLAGLGFLFIAGFLLTSPWWMRAAVERAEYAITNQRVLLSEPPGWGRNWIFPTLNQSFYEYGAAQIGQRRDARRSRKRTDIILETEVHVSNKRSHHVDVGLIGLPDWEEVERILELCFPKASPSCLEETLVGVEPT